MVDQPQLERRLNRLPTKRWWLGFMTIVTIVASAMVLFADNIKAVIGS
ncbi:hypothetical protein [Blastomonas natatoria]|nr:hypothetical protein [Blastomonas natatoria]